MTLSKDYLKRSFKRKSLQALTVLKGLLSYMNGYFQMAPKSHVNSSASSAAQMLYIPGENRT